MGKKMAKTESLKKFKLRKDDQVLVIAGKNKGKQGKVLRLLREKNSLIIEKVNVVKKHQKANQAHPYGGIVEIEAPIHISNVKLVSPKTNKPVRVHYEFKDGNKIRVDQTGQPIDA